MVREVATCSSMEALGWRVPAAPSVGDGWCGQLARNKRVCFHAAAGSLPAAGQQPSASMLLRAAGSPPATTAAEGGLPAPTQPGCVRAAPAPTKSLHAAAAACPHQPAVCPSCRGQLSRTSRVLPCCCGKPARNNRVLPRCCGQPARTNRGVSMLLRAASPPCVHAAARRFPAPAECFRCCGQPARTNQFK